MQKNQILFLLAFVTLFNLFSCKKNYSVEQYTEITDTIPPDLGIKVNTIVAGFINDENNKPVAGAQVVAGSKQTVTDEYGYFKISNVSLSKTAGFIKIAKPGYYPAYRTFTAVENKERFVRVKMLTKTETGTVNSSSGGTVTAADGSKVTLPANGIITASSGAVYTGQVHVAVRLVDMATVTDLQLSVPGDARGIDKDGRLKFLKSYAGIAVELTGNSGEKLQIAANNTANITMPIATALTAAAPATIPLWSFDETNGLWKQESSAVKTGNTYVGNVSHFSFWDGATGIALVNFKAQVLTAALQPLANVPVVITFANQPLNAGYSQFGFTDASGNVSGAIPANANLVLDIMTTCATSAYAYPFASTNTDIDLGTLTGNLGQSVVTITGTVKNCSGQPVTDGYVQTYDHGFYNRINIINGAINFTGLACTNTVVDYVAVDNTTNQQNAPQTITLVPGINNLGALTACGTSTIGYITYVIDGTTRTITAPADTLAAYTFSPFTTIINLSAANQGSPSTTFQFDGGLTVGNTHTVTDIWSPGYTSGRAWAPVPLTVTITEYGNTGGFIKGSFSGLVLDFQTNTPYNVSYDFRIKRFN